MEIDDEEPNSESANRKVDLFEVEDENWINFCLVNDPELSDSNRDSLGGVLTYVLTGSSPSTGQGYDDEYKNNAISITHEERSNQDINANTGLMNEKYMNMNYEQYLNRDSHSYIDIMNEEYLDSDTNEDTSLVNDESLIAENTDNNLNTSTPGYMNEDHDLKNVGNASSEDRDFQSFLRDFVLPKMISEGYLKQDDKDDSELIAQVREDPTKIQSVFRNEMMTNFTNNQDDVDLSSIPVSTEEIDSRETIFRVWDLEIPEEEDPLVDELKKAIEESSIRVQQPSSNQLIAGFTDLDDLISGIAALSLHQSSD